ncbi:MAG: ABC transporter substrate-binding protein [Gammaproteobacteria bacterium]|nr:ABC transporter substrate-binding protein [Gammaproteobacteria bacterium]MBU1441331.1 ABC transporter substrate-binding protein [Gammaproteobacteria bacterium]
MKRFGNLAALAVLAVALGTATSRAAAGPVLDQVRASGTVRVCIWADYYGITFRNPRNQQLVGIDIDLANEFAGQLGARLEFVDSSFPKLIDNLESDRCDIAMHAVGVTPEREKKLRFSKPYLQSDIYGVTTRSSRVVRNWDDIDRPGVKVAVQAGTFMEAAMASALKQASMVVVKAPQTREQELESGRVDVFMTDYPYSRRLLDNADWARLVAPPRPFHPVPYAYAVKPGDDEWLKTVDDFVAKIKADGRLERAARKYGLGEIALRQ